MSERNGSLPAGWVEGSLGEIGRYHNGRGFKKHEWSGTGRPIIRIQNLTDPSKPFNYFEGEVDPRHEVHPGDLLVSWAATLDVFRWRGPEAVLNQHIFKVESFINRDFHYHLLRLALDAVRQQTHGSGMVHITRERFESTPVAIPPLSEQDRIVAITETLLSSVDSGEDALHSALDMLPVLEAAVLQNAIWGSSRKDAALGLSPRDRLAQERRASWERRKAAGKARRSYKPPVSPQPSVGVPAGWELVSLDAACALITDGDHNPPPRQPDGVPHLTAKNIVDGGLDFRDTTFISTGDFEGVKKRYEPLPGDVIVTCVGTIGRVGIVPPDCEFSPDRNLAGLRPLPSVRPEYLVLVLTTPLLQALARDASGSTAQPHLYLGDLRSFPVPLPPLAVQDRLVKKTNAEVSRVATTMTELRGITRRAGQLREAVLRDAFAGRLMSQDPSDEPARELLARVRTKRAEREAEQRAQRARHRSKKQKTPSLVRMESYS